MSNLNPGLNPWLVLYVEQHYQSQSRYIGSGFFDKDAKAFCYEGMKKSLEEENGRKAANVVMFFDSSIDKDAKTIESLFGKVDFGSLIVVVLQGYTSQMKR